MNVIERFLKYVSFDTKSDEASQSVPSTEKQKRLENPTTEDLLKQIRDLLQKNA